MRHARRKRVARANAMVVKRSVLTGRSWRTPFSDGDLTRAEVVDGVVDPFLAVNIHVEQLCARDLDSRDAFGRFGAD